MPGSRLAERSVPRVATIARLPTSLLAVVLAIVAVATPAAALAPAHGFTAADVVDGLREPTALAFLPDGRLLILEKAGAVRVWSDAGGLADAPLLALPSCTDSEMGLLGVALSAGFAFLYHTQPPGGDVARCGEGSEAGRRNRVVRVALAAAGFAPDPPTVVLDGIRTDNGNHDGGGLAIGPDGMLYVATGDTGIGDGGPPGSSTNPYASDLDALEGKILRLALDGTPPPDNPLFGRGGAADRIFAFGLRNPFRFAFDPASGLLWAGDVGQSTFEEIDVVRAGDDLGWPRCEGRRPRSACPGGSVPPVFVYPHGGRDASVTGGVFWNGDYVFADFVRNVVWRASLNPARDGFARRPRRLVRGAGGPVDFAVGPDGALWFVAFKRGSVVRVAPRQRGATVGAAARLW